MAYIIKATLEDTHPPVWRRIALPEGTGFKDLHRVLQIAFGWEEAHLHEFTFPGGDIQIVPRGETIYDDGEYEDRAVALDFLAACKWVRYTYDFGDDWRHKIVLEKTEQPDMGEGAVILKAKGDNFEEDSGGVWSDERVSFDMEAANARLQRLSIKAVKSSKKCQSLVSQLKTGKSVRSMARSMDRLSQIDQLMQLLAEHGAWGQEEEDFIPDFLFDDSARGRMVSDWQGFIDENLFGEGEFVVNLQDVQGTMEEAFAECAEETLALYGSHLQLKESGGEGAVTAGELAVFFHENPRYLLYVLEDEEYIFLKKLHSMPAHRSFSSERVEDADGIIKGIVLGLLNVHISGKSSKRVANLSFTKDAAEIFAALTEEQIQEVRKGLAKAGEQLMKLINSYGFLKIGELVEEFVRLYHSKLEKVEIARIIYWHICFMQKADYLIDEEQGDYVFMPYIDGEYLLEAQARYGVDQVPIRKLAAKELLSDVQDLCGRLKPWKNFRECIQDDFGCKEEEAEYWLNTFYEGVRDGDGVEDLWIMFQDSFDLKYLMVRSETWMMFMDMCLETPLPMLRSHTREEYARLTGKEPWELGLIRWEEAPEEEWETVEGGEYALLRLSPQLQYRIYKNMSTGRSRESGVKLMRQAIQEAGEQPDDLSFLLAMAYMKEARWKDAMRLFKQLEAVDETVPMVLREIKELAPEGMWQDSWDWDAEEEGPADIIPFQRGTPKVGRNDPCPCGSGKKFKKCCMGKGIYD